MNNDLYPQVWGFENLYLAYRKGKRGSGCAADKRLCVLTGLIMRNI
jgi:hypothetical protein